MEGKYSLAPVTFRVIKKVKCIEDMTGNTIADYPSDSIDPSYSLKMNTHNSTKIISKKSSEAIDFHLKNRFLEIDLDDTLSENIKVQKKKNIEKEIGLKEIEIDGVQEAITLVREYKNELLLKSPATEKNLNRILYLRKKFILWHELVNNEKNPLLKKGTFTFSKNVYGPGDFIKKCIRNLRIYEELYNERKKTLGEFIPYSVFSTNCVELQFSEMRSSKDGNRSLTVKQYHERIGSYLLGREKVLKKKMSKYNYQYEKTLFNPVSLKEQFEIVKNIKNESIQNIHCVIDKKVKELEEIVFSDVSIETTENYILEVIKKPNFERMIGSAMKYAKGTLSKNIILVKYIDCVLKKNNRQYENSKLHYPKMELMHIFAKMYSFFEIIIVECPCSHLIYVENCLRVVLEKNFFISFCKLLDKLSMEKRIELEEKIKVKTKNEFLMQQLKITKTELTEKQQKRIFECLKNSFVHSNVSRLFKRWSVAPRVGTRAHREKY